MELTDSEQAAMFRVVNDCSAKTGHFPERLLEALERHLGLRDTVVFVGVTGRDALAAPAVAARGRARAMCDPYTDRFAQHDVFRTQFAERLFNNAGVAALWDFPDAALSRSHTYINEFLGKFGMPSVFGVKISSAPGTAAFLSVLNFSERIPARDAARLAMLRHLLGVYLEPTYRATDENEVVLTGRERQVAALVARGLSNAEIAALLDLKLDTVKKYLTGIFLSYGVTSRARLILTLLSTKT